MTVFEHAARLPKRHAILFHLGAAVLIVVLSVGIYFRTRKYTYLDWDDNTLVEQNVYIMRTDKFPTSHMWAPSLVMGPFLPLRSWSYVFDREWLGADIKGNGPKEHDLRANWHHKTNIFLYVLNGLLLFAMLRKLLDPWTAAIAALIWVVHPVHVEGVAWVSGRKEMLSGTLLVGAFLAYVLSVERSPRAAPRMIPGIVAAVLTVVGTYILWNWIPIAAKRGLALEKWWQVGVVGLFFVVTGAIAACVDTANRKAWLWGSVFAFLAVLAYAGSLLSKPVAVVLPPILIAWEFGHRPLRDRARPENAPMANGRWGTAAISALLLAAAYAGASRFVWQKSYSDVLLRFAVASVLLGVAVVLVQQLHERLVPPDLRKRIQDGFERVIPDTAEALGMLVRSLPFVCLSFWAMSVTVDVAASSAVIKEASWNAAPKIQSVSSFAAIWLDLYHLFVPLKLSALYDVKSDAWHWQSILGLIILISLPFASAWIVWKSPKSLVWLAWLVWPIVPVSGIIRIAAPHADRYLYLPAIAVAVALAYLLVTAAFGSEEETGLWERIVAVVLMIAIIGGFTKLSYDRVAVWRNDEALWGDAVEKNPDLPSALNNYGAALMNNRKVEQALDAYYRAYKVLPTLDVAQFNIAATELRLQRPDKAQKYGEEFIAQHPEMPTGFILMSQIYLAQQRQAEKASNAALAAEKLGKAAEMLKIACDLPVGEVQELQLQDKANGCAQAANVLYLMGNTTGMDLYIQKGYSVIPNSRSVKMMEIKLLRAQKKFKEAREKALEAHVKQPTQDTARLLMNIAIDLKLYQEAIDYIELLCNRGLCTQKDVLLRQRLQEAIAQGKEPDFTVPTPPPVEPEFLIDPTRRTPGDVSP